MQQDTIKFYIKFIFVLLILISFSLIIYTLHYNVMVDHDLIYGYGREFFNPEHGRYIATAINSLLSEHIPYLFNIHPNDFIPMVVGPIKAVVIIFFCLIMADSFFIYSKEEKNLFKFDFGNIYFLLLFLVCFLLFFNNNWIFDNEWAYFATLQSTVFWEYPCSTIYYIIFVNIFGYYYINKKIPTDKNWLFLIISTFLLGISIEPINIPTLFSLTVLFILLIINRKNIEITAQRKFLKIYTVFLISIIIYYINPNDSHIDYGAYNFYSYIINEFHNFLNAYLNDFLIPYAYCALPTLIISCAVYKTNKHLSIYTIINTFSIIIFFFMLFLLGYNCFNMTEKTFLCSYPKWIFLYKMIAVYHLISILGYYLNTNLRKTKAIYFQIIFSILFLAIVFTNLSNYKNNIKIWIEERKEIRTISYIVEKLATTSIKNKEMTNIIIPTNYQYKNKTINLQNKWFHLGEYRTNFFIYNLRYLHYPDLENKQHIIFDDEYKIENDLFSVDELEKLHFQKLLSHRIHKNKLLGEKFPYSND